MNEGKTVLVVDDDKDFLDLMSLILEKAKFRVLEAQDAGECLSHLDHESVDLIITDISMPKINGLELTSLVRSRLGHSNIPIMLLTGGGASLPFHDIRFRADSFWLKDRIDGRFINEVSSLMNHN